MAEKISPLMAQDLTGLAGKEDLMLTVEYAPGESSTKHRHNAHVFVYVLEGSHATVNQRRQAGQICN